MQLFKRYPGRTAAALLASLALMAACSDRSNPAGPKQPDPGGPKGPGTGEPLHMKAIECRVEVKKETVSCDPPSGNAGGALADDIEYGGQNIFVTLKSSNVNYDAGTEKFTFDVTVRNLIPQPIGTVDGTTLDPYGIKVYFDPQPTATVGTGAITVENTDGSATFTGSEPQPYYQYNTVLDQFEVSAPKAWQFNVPPTVQEFTFLVYLSSAVPHPRGWITFSQTSFNLRPPADKSVGIQSYNPYGQKDTTAFVTTFEISDTTRATLATLNDTTINVIGVRAGTVQIIATNTHPYFGVRSDTVTWNVTGTVRVWKGQVDTDYGKNNNWRSVHPASGRQLRVRPQPVDTILISPDSLEVPGQYPVLVQNEQIGGIQIDNEGILNLNAFDITATQNVRASSTLASSSSGILSSTGRLVLSGIAKTVSGRVPRVLVTGTYTLDANVNSRLQTRVDAGRLTNPAFRYQIENN